MIYENSSIAGAGARRRFGLEPGQGLGGGAVRAVASSGDEVGAAWYASGYRVAERGAAAKWRGGLGRDHRQSGGRPVGTAVGGVAGGIAGSVVGQEIDEAAGDLGSSVKDKIGGLFD